MLGDIAIIAVVVVLHIWFDVSVTWKYVFPIRKLQSLRGNVWRHKCLLLWKLYGRLAHWIDTVLGVVAWGLLLFSSRNFWRAT